MIAKTQSVSLMTLKMPTSPRTFPAPRPDDVRRCVEEGRRQFPTLPWDAARDCSAGWDNFVLDVGARWIFRFPRASENVPQLEREIRLLPVLRRHLSVRIPTFEFVGRREGGITGPFVGYSRLPGEPLVRTEYTERDVLSIGAALEALLAQLGAVPPAELESIGLPRFPAKEWRGWYEERNTEWEKTLLGDLPNDLARKVRADGEAFVDNRENFSFEPLLIHRDLSGDHILWDGNQVTGIIDWGDATLGDPAFDLVGLEFLGPVWMERLARTRERAMGPRWRERVAFYQRRSSQIGARAALNAGNRDRFDHYLRAIQASYPP